MVSHFNMETGKTDETEEPTRARVWSESKSNIRWGYQPGAAPQQSLHLKFSSQAFSSAFAFLP